MVEKDPLVKSLFREINSQASIGTAQFNEIKSAAVEMVTQNEEPIIQIERNEDDSNPPAIDTNNLLSQASHEYVSHKLE